MKLRPGLLKRYSFAPPTVFGLSGLSQGSNQFSINAPGGTAANDILIVVWRGSQADGNPTSTGYTHVPGSPVTGTTSKMAVLWKRATGTSNNIATFPDADISTGNMAFMMVVRGCRTVGNPFNTQLADTQASATAISIPSIAIADGPVLMTYVVAHNTQTGTEFTAEANANLTSIVERADVTSGLGNGGIMVTTGILTSPGASGIFTTTKLTATDTVRITVPLISH